MLRREKPPQMSIRVLIVNSDHTSAQTLARYFNARGDQAWQTDKISRAFDLLAEQKPQLVLIDLHLPGNGWLELVAHLRHTCPVIVTNKRPDVRREMQAKEQGASVFLREPFTPTWIERALHKVDQAQRRALQAGGRRAQGADQPAAGDQRQPARGAPRLASAEFKPAPHPPGLPRVRIPIRVKITLPFALLALSFAIAAVYLGSRLIFESMQARFTNQLLDAGGLAADSMVQAEQRLLENLRLLANTQGVPAALANGDAEALRRLALPLVVNARLDSVDFVAPSGLGLLSLHSTAAAGQSPLLSPDSQPISPESYHWYRGETGLAALECLQAVLAQQADWRGDKFAGLARTTWGDFFLVAGPVLNEDGSLAGAVLVGESVPNLARAIRAETLAQVSFYAPDGSRLASTLLLDEQVAPLEPGLLAQVVARQDQATLVRTMQVASASYSELLGAWEARAGADLGVMGVALAQKNLVSPAIVFRFQAFFVAALVFVGVIFIGVLLARQVTIPLAHVVEASTLVAQGNLDVKVPAEGDDEVMVLAHAFNRMISGLQEGVIYRDLLGRTVSPEVREALRRSFACGDLRLEGQTAVATVLMSDIRGFTSLSENEQPTTILRWLNEYFGELVPIVASHSGVVDKFEGDAMLAFFGLLPTPVSPQESAFQACQAAMQMVAAIEALNARRARRGEPALRTGIGINTGPLIAGGLGTHDRLNFTIIGDTVNTTQRLQTLGAETGPVFGDAVEGGLARDPALGGPGAKSLVVISESTWQALGERRAAFQCWPLGQHAMRGRRAQVSVYQLGPAIAAAAERQADRGQANERLLSALAPLRQPPQAELARQGPADEQLVSALSGGNGAKRPALPGAAIPPEADQGEQG
jgi:class 3 adenylate cyclase/CheY-like chemotaxis protein/HAMP domain-containing protein